MQNQYDVIVIGGGISGLRAARDLTSAGRRVLVLEAQDRLGGRVYYDQFADTDSYVEFGGGWFNPQFHHLMAAEMERYSLPIALTAKPASTFLWLTEGTIRTGYSPVPLEYMADMERGVYETIRAAKRIEFGSPWDKQDLADLDISWESFVKSIKLASPVEEFFLTWCSSSRAEETNALDILTWVAGFDNSPWRLNAEGMLYHFVNGTKSLVDALAAEGGEVVLDSPAAKIEQDDNGVRVTTRSGETFTAATTVLTLPVNVWRDVEFSPPLSAPKQEVSAELHPGRTVKVWAVLGDAPQEGFSAWGEGEGCNWLLRYDEIAEGDLYVGFSGGFDLDPTDPEAVQNAVRVFDPNAKVVKFHAHDWRANEFEKGTWLIRRPGEGLRYHSQLPAREGRFVFGGSDTSFGWNGWMEGALEAGSRAATEAISVLEGVTTAD